MTVEQVAPAVFFLVMASAWLAPWWIQTNKQPERKRERSAKSLFPEENSEQRASGKQRKKEG